MVKLKKMEIISTSRPIIEAVLNDKKRNFLLDTGASVGMLSDKIKGLHKSNRTVTIIDASGDDTECFLVDDFVVYNGRKTAQFVVSDFSGIQDSIYRETSVWIDGIIGYLQMRILGSELKEVQT